MFAILRKPQAFLAVFGILLLLSCAKIQLINADVLPAAVVANSVVTNDYGYPFSYGIIDSFPTVNYDVDSIERPTLLGRKRVNPYTLANIQQAYANLGVTGFTVQATNQYIKFFPSSVNQMATLDSFMQAKGLELFDTPMDYDVLMEGDYYQDPAVPDESVTYQYAVVPTNFVFPAGITYQVLATIHIPPDDYTAVETEAERLAAMQDSVLAASGGGTAAQPNVTCGAGYHWDIATQRCVPNLCHDGEACPPTVPPPSTLPPAPDAQTPAGNITVQDVNLGTNPGVRTLRVIAKRWFKIEQMYTDNSGHFVSSKRFKHKVKIVAKFKNNFANIRGIRGVRFWQMLNCVRKTLGVYKSGKNVIGFNFGRVTGTRFTSTKGNRYWVAATGINSIMEQRDYAAQFGFALPPSDLNIYITNWGITAGLGSTPLFNKRFISDLPNSYINTYLLGLSGLVSPPAAFLLVLTRVRLDLAIDYHEINIGNFTSDRLKSTLYHELCHASHYTQVGAGWYGSLVSAELRQIAAHPLPSDNLNPYGGSNSSDAPIIAVGETWGYHMGHFLAGQRYGANGDNDISVQANQASPGIDLVALENFQPGQTLDPFRWIPKGIMLDLIDNTPNEPGVNDNVNGFTTQQLFSALQSDVGNMAQYRSKLILLNGAQQAQITDLFTSYNF